MDKKNKTIFICWGREAALSLNFADMMQAEFRQVYFKKVKRIKLPTAIRYAVQFFYTIYVLAKNRPSLVIVQNPPVFAPLTVWLYCLLFRARFVIDTHTAAFWDKKWRFFFLLFKFAAKRAALNTYHNFKNAEILKSWGIKNILPTHFGFPNLKEILKDPELEDENLSKAFSGKKSSVLMVNRFASDDDFYTVIEAARKLPHINFFITGNIPAKLRPDLEKLKTSNIIFTGYIKHPEFIKLMNKCNLVLAFTLRRDTRLWSVQEALALNKPVITSDSEVLRRYFGDFALFNKSDPEKLSQQIEYAIGHEKKIKAEMEIFLEKDKISYKKHFEDIKKFLNIKQ